MANGEFAKQSFTGLPPWAKGALAVGGLAIVAIVGYKIYKGIKDKTSGKEQGDRQEDRGWNKEFDKLNSNPATKATLSKTQMLSYATSLFTAMDGYGTDFPTILNVFKAIKNDADFAGISAAYGNREVSSGNWNPEPNYKGPLSGALTSELDAMQKAMVNKLLKGKKINYQIS